VKIASRELELKVGCAVARMQFETDAETAEYHHPLPQSSDFDVS